MPTESKNTVELPGPIMNLFRFKCRNMQLLYLSFFVHNINYLTNVKLILDEMHHLNTSMTKHLQASLMLNSFG